MSNQPYLRLSLFTAPTREAITLTFNFDLQPHSLRVRAPYRRRVVTFICYSKFHSDLITTSIPSLTRTG